MKNKEGVGQHSNKEQESRAECTVVATSYSVGTREREICLSLYVM